MANESSGRSTRGFASMDKSKQKEIASKGGKAAHEKGTAHEFNSEEASRAAKKGHERGTAHEFTSEEARIAGRKGGMARASQWSKSQNGNDSRGDNGQQANRQEEPQAQEASNNAISN